MPSAKKNYILVAGECVATQTKALYNILSHELANSARYKSPEFYHFSHQKISTLQARQSFSSSLYNGNENSLSSARDTLHHIKYA